MKNLFFIIILFLIERTEVILDMKELIMTFEVNMLLLMIIQIYTSLVEMK